MDLQASVWAKAAPTPPEPASGVPAGVCVRQLHRHFDERGDLVEVFRASWGASAQPVQWNLVRNRPGTLRGVHLHWRHEDYLIPAVGRMWLALKDLREDSPTFGLSCELDLHGDDVVAVSVPTGVAHGFYFPAESAFLYGVSHYWDTEDELACAWNDPELGFGWAPVEAPPRLSPRDRDAGSMTEMVQSWRARRGVAA